MTGWHAVFCVTMFTIGITVIVALVFGLRRVCTHKPSTEHTRYQHVKDVELGQLIESTPEEVVIVIVIGEGCESEESRFVRMGAQLGSERCPIKRREPEVVQCRWHSLDQTLRAIVSASRDARIWVHVSGHGSKQGSVLDDCSAASAASICVVIAQFDRRAARTKNNGSFVELVFANACHTACLAHALRRARCPLTIGWRTACERGAAARLAAAFYLYALADEDLDVKRAFASARRALLAPRCAGVVLARSQRYLSPKNDARSFETVNAALYAFVDPDDAESTEITSGRALVVDQTEPFVRADDAAEEEDVVDFLDTLFSNDDPAILDTECKKEEADENHYLQHQPPVPTREDIELRVNKRPRLSEQGVDMSYFDIVTSHKPSEVCYAGPIAAGVPVIFAEEDEKFAVSRSRRPTPLDSRKLTSLGKRKIKRLIQLGIRTVEDLANLDTDDVALAQAATGNRRPNQARRTLATWRDKATLYLRGQQVI